MMDVKSRPSPWLTRPTVSVDGWRIYKNKNPQHRIRRPSEPTRNCWQACVLINCVNTFINNQRRGTSAVPPEFRQLIHTPLNRSSHRMVYTTFHILMKKHNKEEDARLFDSLEQMKPNDCVYTDLLERKGQEKIITLLNQNTLLRVQSVMNKIIFRLTTVTRDIPLSLLSNSSRS